jgi:gamma-glutamylcyclotransferase
MKSTAQGSRGLDSRGGRDATTTRGGRTRPRGWVRAMLVFSYGSNLDGAQMRARCPSARLLGRARLPGHALVFGGFSGRWGGAVASVVRRRGQAVEGILYALSKADLRALDGFEGAPWVYERVARLVTTEGGARRRAFVYALCALGPGHRPPAPCYLAVLWRAYERLRFDPAPLARAALDASP